MGLNIFFITDFIDKLFGRLKGEVVQTSEQKTVVNANKRYMRLIGRGDRYVLNGELPNVKPKDVDKVLKMGAEKREDGSLFVPKGVDLSPFRKYSPMIAEDLDDEHSLYKTTADGLPWENFVTLTDTSSGADSTATSVVYGMIPVLAALTIVLLALPSWLALSALIPALLVIPHLVALKQGESFAESVKIGFIAFMFPVLLSVYAVVAIKSGAAPVPLDAMTSMGGGGQVLPVIGGVSNGFMGVLMAGMGVFFWLAATAVIFTVGCILNYDNQDKLGGAFQGGIDWVWGWTKLSVGVALALMLPTMMAPWVVLLFAAAYSMRYTERNFQARGWILDQQNKVIGGVIQDRSHARAIEDRQFQAKNVHNDKTPTIVIAIATGYLASKGYEFSPDANKKMVLSIKDLCTHMLSLGRTGIGKTTSFARLIALQIALASMRGYRVGLFVLCGKGSLPGELNNVLEKNIKPGMAVGLIEGLDAEELAVAINSMVSSDGVKDPIWSQGADTHVVNAAILFEALCQHEEAVYKHAVMELNKIDMMLPNLEYIVKDLYKNPNTQGSEQHVKAVRELQNTRDRRSFYIAEIKRPREWRWCVDDFLAVLVLLDDVEIPRGSEVGEIGKNLKRWLNFLGVNVVGDERQPIAIHPEVRRHGSSLQKAISYVVKTWVPRPHQQRESFRLNVDQRINPLIQSKKLVDENGTPWTALTTGVDITDVMRGARYGIDLPQPIYGSAGVAVSVLLKQRVYAQLKKRAVGNWEKDNPDATVFIQVMDECQLLVSKQERELLPIARSLGMGAAYLTQNVEGLMPCFDSKDALEGFLDQFQSITCSMASEATYEFVMRKVGHGSLIQYNPTGRGLDYKAGTNAFKRSTLNMEDHPQRAFLRRMKRWGLGKVVSRDMMANDYGRRWDQKWDALRGTNVDERGFSSRSAIMIGGSGSKQDGPIVTMAELGLELNTSGGARALVYLNRGNVRRVDFARTIPVTPSTVDEYLEKFRKDNLESELFENEAA